MSQNTSQALLSSALTKQVTMDPSSDPTSSQTLQNMSRRSSARSSLFGTTPVARSNSMGSLRRSSRASSQPPGIDQVPGEQSMVAVPENFDFDADNWSYSDLRLDAQDFPLDEAAVDAPDYFTYNSYGNGFQFNAMAQPFAGPWQGQTETADGLVGDDVIDPALLAMQPQHPYTASDPTLESTPGLTAVPGEISLIPPMQPAQVAPMYPDPTGVYPVQPYYISQGYPPYPDYQRQGYQPYPAYQEQGYQQQYYAPMLSLQYAPRTDLALPVTSKKRVRSDFDSESDAPVKKARVPPQPIRNEDEDESDGIVVTKAARARQSKRLRRESRESGASSSSSLSKPSGNKVASVGQKPQKCEEKPWVRINGNTKGETTRTARINVEANQTRKYKYMPLPHGDWESSNYKFEYVTHGGLDEFKSKSMSPQQIKEYITQYPSNDLILWLQVSPADTARRYASLSHSKCLFEKCPKRVWGDNGTIDVGHFRVAFDEKFKQHGNKVVDPFDCPGFVHLYCLERFCDFERICHDANVRVDTRVDLPREHTQAKWTMSGRPETKVAMHFFKACRQGKLRETQMFEYYPVHESSKKLKPFGSTLAHALADTNISNRTRSQIRQFTDRKLTSNAFTIHMGDMEVAMTQKKIKKTKPYKKAQRAKAAAQFDFTAYYDDYDPIINQRIAKFTAIGEQIHAQDANDKPRRAKARGVSKRKHVAVQDSDSESEPEFNDLTGPDFEDLEEVGAYNATPPTRSSARKRQRVNYALDEPALPSIHHQQSTPAIHHQQPLPSIAAPQDPYQGYVSPDQQPRLESISHLFPTNMSSNFEDYMAASSIDPSFTLAEYDELSQLLERRKSFTVPGTPGPTQAEFDALMLQYLERRKSSTLSMGPGMKSALRSPTESRAGRQASFHVQPVSRSKEFEKDDPPSKVAGRRSGRLASRAGEAA
jgi:hypothetical protein